MITLYVTLIPDFEEMSQNRYILIIYGDITPLYCSIKNTDFHNDRHRMVVEPRYDIKSKSLYFLWDSGHVN